MAPTKESPMAATSFLQSLEFDIDIKWRGKFGIHRLDDDRHVRLTLTTNGKHQHWEGMRGKVFHKQSGELDHQTFMFDDFLSASLGQRKDGRSDHPLGSNTCFQVIEHCGWHWYISEPKTTKPFCEAVESWIGEWR